MSENSTLTRAQAVRDAIVLAITVTYDLNQDCLSQDSKWIMAIIEARLPDVDVRRITANDGIVNAIVGYTDGEVLLVQVNSTAFVMGYPDPCFHQLAAPPSGYTPDGCRVYAWRDGCAVKAAGVAATTVNIAEDEKSDLPIDAATTTVTGPNGAEIQSRWTNANGAKITLRDVGLGDVRITVGQAKTDCFPDRPAALSFARFALPSESLKSTQKALQAIVDAATKNSDIQVQFGLSGHAAISGRIGLPGHGEFRGAGVHLNGTPANISDLVSSFSADLLDLLSATKSTLIGFPEVYVDSLSTTLATIVMLRFKIAQ